MIESGFYKINPSYFNEINKLGSIYSDRKERPLYCCIKDKKNKEIYWLIPTSDYSHRTKEQIEKLNEKLNSKNKLIASYYHIATTNKKAIYKISLALPVTSKYIDGEYTSQGQHLILKNKKAIAAIQNKLNIILEVEKKNPNRFEQKISLIYSYLEKELHRERIIDEVKKNNYIIDDAKIDSFIKLEKLLSARLTLSDINTKYGNITILPPEESELVKELGDFFLEQKKNKQEHKRESDNTSYKEFIKDEKNINEVIIKDDSKDLPIRIVEEREL